MCRLVTYHRPLGCLPRKSDCSAVFTFQGFSMVEGQHAYGRPFSLECVPRKIDCSSKLLPLFELASLQCSLVVLSFTLN